MGQLFNQFPNSMYLYEPVAGLYSAMYGSQDWTFPLGVLLNVDGSFRCGKLTFRWAKAAGTPTVLVSI